MAAEQAGPAADPAAEPHIAYADTNGPAIPPELAAALDPRLAAARAARAAELRNAQGLFQARLIRTDAKKAPELTKASPVPGESSTKADTGSYTAAEPAQDPRQERALRKATATDEVTDKPAAHRNPTPAPMPRQSEDGAHEATPGAPSAGRSPEPPADTAGPEPAIAAPPRLQAADPKAPSAPVKALQFEISEGAQRVAVRLTERAGELHVAVRTPDSRLAVDLQDNLPALSARLEPAGYRAEGWSTDGATPERVARNAGPAAGGNPDQSDARRQNPGSQQQEPEKRNSKEQTETGKPEEKRKDVSWFASNLQQERI